MAHTPDLPESEKAFLAIAVKDPHLLRQRVHDLNKAGWTLQSIGDAFSPPRRRSTVRSWVIAGERKDELSSTFPGDVFPTLPLPPVKKRRARSTRPASPGIPLDEQLRIARLAPIARRYRAKTSPRSASFTANMELTRIAGDLYQKGVTISELAKVTGVTYRAMRRRIDRALVA